MKFRCHCFTLLELAVVVVILVLLTTVAGIYIRRDRKVHEFERSLRDFQVFCARARAATMHDGVSRKIVFYPDEQLFRIEEVELWNDSGAIVTVEAAENNDNTAYVVLDVVDPDAEEESAAEVPGRENIEERFLTWRFPASLGLNIDLPELDGVEFTEESLELWRYTTGGSARLQYGLKVRLNEDARLITVSDFTGLVEVVRDTGEEGHRVF